MPQLRELGQKVRWHLRNRFYDYGLKTVGLSHELSSGYVVRIESYADWTIYNDIFVDQEYDPAITAALSSKAADSVVILDLGANVGFFTLRVAELLHRIGLRDVKLQMILVEGSPSVFRKLTGRLNGQPILSGRYRAVNGLVGQRDGIGTIYEIPYHGLVSTVPRRLSRPVKVDFVNLDELCKLFGRISLIKCDIEGAEELFLANYPSLLRKTDAIVLEFHHSGINYQQCVGRLKEAGLTRHEVLVDKKVVTTELFRR